MSTNVPNEIIVAKLSIEAASVALESLFERMNAMPRAEKVIVNDMVREACLRLQAAKDLLTQLETVPAARPACACRQRKTCSPSSKPFRRAALARSEAPRLDALSACRTTAIREAKGRRCRHPRELLAQSQPLPGLSG
jgi:hypothetical protein